MTEEKRALELQDPSSHSERDLEVKEQEKKRKEKPGINLAKILRKKKRGEAVSKTGDKEVDQIIEALEKEPDVLDFIVRNGESNELYRFYFIGRYNEKADLGRKVTKNLVHYACPECGEQTLVIVLEKRGEAFIGRISGEELRTFEIERATIHCGKLHIFPKSKWAV